jgi:hypothetical protein
MRPLAIYTKLCYYKIKSEKGEQTVNFNLLGFNPPQAVSALPLVREGRFVLLGFNSPPLGAVKTGGAGVMFPRYTMISKTNTGGLNA